MAPLRAKSPLLELVPPPSAVLEDQMLLRRALPLCGVATPADQDGQRRRYIVLPRNIEPQTLPARMARWHDTLSPV